MRPILKTATILLISLAGFKAKAQEQIKADTGIHFEQSLKWSEILAKAKTEHKYIFVDCYATWCGPCKWMDANVYPLKEVGDTYNNNFISVRLQMDQTVADDSLTKTRYDRAKTFEKNYHVDAYPTLLFFDPDGNPVHKVTGSLDAKQFIQLASDAQNPDKQYYAILKNFQPGKLDTADERGLPLAFIGNDKKLAANIATDYLSRIPRTRLKTYDSGRLLFMFHDDPRVAAIVTSYVSSFTKKDILKNADFIAAMSKQPAINQISVHYITTLNQQEICRPENLSFIEKFRDDPRVQQTAQKFIASLPIDQRFNQPSILFIANFTQTTHDQGFQFFYAHTAHIDTVMKDDHFVQNDIKFWIANTNWQPLFTHAKQSGITPDFGRLTKELTERYSGQYAVKVILDAKVDWYGYLVAEKKQDNYWPQLVKANLDRDKQYLADKKAVPGFWVNNACWDAYLHIDDPAILSLADSLMTQLVKNTPDEFANFDTYASVLYKSGKMDQAVSVEEQVLQKFDNVKHPVLAASFRSKITAMQKGEKIWLDKDYQ